MTYNNIERNSKRQATLPPRTSPTNIGYFYPEHHPSAVMTFGMRNLEPFNENGIPVAWEDMFSNYYQMQMMIVTGGPIGNPVSGWQGIGVFSTTNAADTSHITSPHEFEDNIHLALSYYSNQIVVGLTPDLIEGSGWIAFTVECYHVAKVYLVAVVVVVVVVEVENKIQNQHLTHLL